MPRCSIEPSGEDLNETEDKAKTSPVDHAGTMPEGPWAIRHLAVDGRISRLLEAAGIVDLRDASRERITGIKGIGPAAVAAFEKALPIRLQAISLSGIHVPTPEAVLNGEDPHAVPVVEAAPVKRRSAGGRTPKTDAVSSRPRKPKRASPRKVSSGIDAPHTEGADAQVLGPDVAQPPSDREPSDAETTAIPADEPTERTVEAPSPIMEAVLCAGEPYPVELSGGTIIAQSIGGNRMLVLCHDRYLQPHVAQACIDEGGTPEGRGWVLDLRAYDRMTAALRSESFSDGLRDRNQVWTRIDPTHRTPRGTLHIRPFETGGKAYIDVKSHPYERTMVRRLDVVCPALGGKWNPMKRCWAVHAHQQTALLRAMEPDESPKERGLDEYGTPERTFREAGLEYASVFGNKPDLDWYDANGQIILVETPEGRVEIVRVDPEVWIARKPNKGNPGINATITEACGTMLGSQGNWHPPFAGRRFHASRAEEVIARLKRGLPKDDADDFPEGLF